MRPCCNRQPNKGAKRRQAWACWLPNLAGGQAAIQQLWDPVVRAPCRLASNSVITTVPTLGEQAEYQRQACLNSNRPSRATEFSKMSQADYRDRQFLAVIGDEVRLLISAPSIVSVR